MDNFYGRSILSMTDLTVEDIEDILATAPAFKEISQREIKKIPTLRGKTVVNMFFEDSTRTRISFEIAAKRLSADVINVNVEGSSLSKGENLYDMVDNIAAMGTDAIIVRHGAEKVPHRLAKRLRIPVINAGDGINEHPTQALLDLFTIKECLGSLKGHKVLLVGDVANSRVARSNIIAMTKLGMQVFVCTPRTYHNTRSMDMDYPNVEYSNEFEEFLPNVDVVMMLRIQRERHLTQYFPATDEYIRHYCLTLERLRLAKPGVIIMHPGPVNRGFEIESEVVDNFGKVILQQVTNGVSVRMALLYLLLTKP